MTTLEKVYLWTCGAVMAVSALIVWLLHDEMAQGVEA